MNQRYFRKLLLIFWAFYKIETDYINTITPNSFISSLPFIAHPILCFILTSTTSNLPLEWDHLTRVSFSHFGRKLIFQMETIVNSSWFKEGNSYPPPPQILKYCQILACSVLVWIHACSVSACCVLSYDTAFLMSFAVSNFYNLSVPSWATISELKVELLDCCGFSLKSSLPTYYSKANILDFQAILVG